jgi:hypothetical protein
MKIRMAALLGVLSLGCAGEPGANPPDPEQARQEIFDVLDARVAALIAGTDGREYRTGEWRGVNLNGTPMSAEGFEGEDRSMQYDNIEILDRDVRVYGETAALRWHGNFHVRVNGEPSFAEMRLLDVYVLRDGRWLLDLTQVTPVYGTVGNPPER